ncbi:MAG: M48 family metalloprotease, partial [Gemmatimonadota bacterium]
RVATWGAIFGGRDREGGALGMLVMAVVAPVAAMLIQFAISRQNEFQADRTGAEIAGNPMGLANALLKLDAYSRRIPMRLNPAGASLAIVNPLAGQRSNMASWFSTHPPTEERVQRLQEMARSGGAGE